MLFLFTSELVATATITGSASKPCTPSSFQTSWSTDTGPGSTPTSSYQPVTFQDRINQESISQEELSKSSLCQQMAYSLVAIMAYTLKLIQGLTDKSRLFSTASWTTWGLWIYKVLTSSERPMTLAKMDKIVKYGCHNFKHGLEPIFERHALGEQMDFMRRVWWLVCLVYIPQQDWPFIRDDFALFPQYFLLEKNKVIRRGQRAVQQSKSRKLSPNSLGPSPSD